MVHFNHTIAQLNYGDRMARSELMRMQTGQHGDIRDLPTFTAEGRAALRNDMWRRMGGEGTFEDAMYVNGQQRKAAKWQAASDIITGACQLAKVIAGFFGK